MDNPAIPPPRMIMCSHFAPVMVVAAFFTFVRVGDTSVLRGLNLRIWVAFDVDGCIGMGRVTMAASLDAIVAGSDGGRWELCELSYNQKIIYSLRTNARFKFEPFDVCLSSQTSCRGVRIFLSLSTTTSTTSTLTTLTTATVDITITIISCDTCNFTLSSCGIYSSSRS